MARGPKSQLSDAQTRVILATLICYMDPRGQDSWGAWADGQEWKGLGLASHGAELSKISKAQRILIHTRKGTVGKISVENSHPFTFTGDGGSFTGIHNGSVSNWRALNSRLDRSLDVDSMQIWQHMAEGRDLGELDVRGAVAYVDAANEDRIYFQRIKNGALEAAGLQTIPNSDEITDVIVCSLYPGIKSACKLAEVEFSNYLLKDDVRYYTENGNTMHDTPEIGLEFGTKPIEFQSYSRGNFNTNHLGFQRGPNHQGTSAYGRRATTKNYLQGRSTYLEGYNGDDACVNCSVTARLKARATGIRYCFVCWTKWEQLASFKKMNSSLITGATFKPDKLATDEELVEGILCEWGCDDARATYFVWSDGMQSAFFVCDDCILGVDNAANVYNTSKLSDLKIVHSVTAYNKECEGCQREFGVAYFKPENYNLGDGNFQWYCLECLRIGLLCDLDELEDIKLVEGAKKVNCDAANDDYVKLPNGIMKRVKPIELDATQTKEPDESVREKIRQRLIGPEAPKYSAKREGLILAEPSEMNKSVGNVLSFFAPLFGGGRREPEQIN